MCFLALCVDCFLQREQATGRLLQPYDDIVTIGQTLLLPQA
jgi:hypothetical protein